MRFPLEAVALNEGMSMKESVLMLAKLMLVAVFGGLGCVLRYALSSLIGGARTGDAAVLPLGTMVVNIVGCLVMGVVASLLTGSHTVRDEWRLALMVGLLGGFTTFSSFSIETLELASEGQFGRAIANIVITNACCLAAVWAGFRLTERLAGA